MMSIRCMPGKMRHKDIHVIKCKKRQKTIYSRTHSAKIYQVPPLCVYWFKSWDTAVNDHDKISAFAAF